ncbi:acetyl-CoA acetyltransferase [candidate division MSBL1 archaeon SCGC-AAA259I09]|uniref:propanoyl-CoA C-acyltransferase n=1 Tax=candidate division MSBL1 archaeon SCGC-AAA259I09 TaxID=1698267 RepID=A0A133US04_9EURY|nr:acetyl-CoA acetyltransferase [candidate division MSBL1 archaeon SCGC-AAA259I09]
MNVAIVGTGQSKFSRDSGLQIRELAFEAYREAMKDVNLSKKDIDASIVCSAPEYDPQRSPSSGISEYLGLDPRPTFYAESICSSSTTGVRAGYGLIGSGLHDVLVIVGFQKMSELSSTEAQERMERGADIMWESPFGLTMPAGYAIHARAHMEEFGTTEEQMAKVKVKSGKYSKLNPDAVFQREVMVDEVLNSQVISSPLKFFDCCANADGASCMILAKEDKAKEITDTPVWVEGIGSATNVVSLSAREKLTGLKSAEKASQTAYEMAGISPEDVDVAEVHDCFTIAEIMAYEDLGFCEKGEGGKLIEEEQTYMGGKYPVNIDGGLLSKGHPVGATGGSQVNTIFKQLRGEGGRIQVEGAETGLVHNIGGIGTYANVIIFGR